MQICSPPQTFCQQSVEEKFREYEGSKTHKEATQKLAEKARGVKIDAQLNVQLRDDQKHHRPMFMKLLHATQLLSRQGLPFRSHKEDIVSFSGYISYYYFRLTKDCPERISWLNRKAPEIDNEIISAMGQSVLCNNLADIFTAIWYSIIADGLCHFSVPRCCLKQTSNRSHSVQPNSNRSRQLRNW